MLVNVRRPVLLNGIEDVATSPDLQDRSITVYVLRIKKKGRRSEKKLERDFDVELREGLLDATPT